MRSVIYREARGFNGQPGDIICEMENDVPPAVGDIIEISKKNLTEKRRHVVESLTKEVYQVTGHDQIVWVAGVTRLHERGRFPIDDEDIEELVAVFKARASAKEALRRILGDAGSIAADPEQLVRELLVRLS